jgi:hypothetical protein
MENQSVDQRLKDAINRASKRLSQKASTTPSFGGVMSQSSEDAQAMRRNRQAGAPENTNDNAKPSAQDTKRDPSAAYGTRKGERRLDSEGDEVDITRPSKDFGGLPRVPMASALYDQGGTLPKIRLNDGNHEVALVKETNERILTPEQTKDYDAKHPSARKQPMELDAKTYGLPKVKGYDIGGLVGVIGDVAKTEGKDFVKSLDPRNKKSGGAVQNMPEQDTETYDVSHPASRLQWQPLGQLPSYDSGGEVQDDNQASDPFGRIQLPQDSQDTQDAQLKSLPFQPAPSESAIGEGAPIQRSTQPDQLSPERQDIDDRKVAAAKKGPAGLIDLGLANIHEREMDKHEARTQSPLGNAMPSLVPATAEMPQYTGPGKPVAQGDLIPDKQLPTDEYKFKQADLDKRIETARDKSVDENATPAERASAKTLADNLEFRREELKRPAATTLLGRIGRGFEKAGNIAGNLLGAPEMELIPGTDLYKAAQRQGTLGRIGTDVAQEKEIAAINAESSKATKSPWKAAVGEQFTQYDSTGKPIRQLFTNENSGEQQWRDLPTAGGMPKIQTASTAGTVPAGAGAAPAGAAPAADTKAYYGVKEAANRPIGDAGVKQVSDQAKSASLRVPKGYDVAPPTFTKDDTAETAKDKMKDYETSVNNAILADRSDKAAAARETAQESKERRAEDRKDKGVSVYAEDENGQTVLTNKYMAQLKGQAFEVATPGDINKDRQATRQLNDVQLNVSRYTKAANDAAKTPPTTEDYVNMHSILNKAGALDLNIAISEGGNIKIPVLSGMIEGLNREVNSEAYAALSPSGKALLDGYIRSMSAVPAYQKALTGIGRSNKEMLDLELANIPNPTMKPADIQRKLGQFQENIDRATEGFPKLPGLKSAKQTREETKGKGKTETATPSTTTTLPNTGSAATRPDGSVYPDDTQQKDSKGKVVRTVRNGKWQ